MQAVVLLAAGPHAVRGPVREIRARPGSPQGCAPGLLHGGEGALPPAARASAPGRSAQLHPSTAGTTRADSALIFPAPPRRRLHRPRRVRPSPRPHTPPRGRLRFYTRPTMHYTSFAMRPAYSFQIPGGKGTLGGSPARRRRGGGGRGGGAETCSVKAMGAQTMARFSAGVLSQLGATAQKTQTNEAAEACGADPAPGAREAGGAAADPPRRAAHSEARG